jgi:hypothetical protein
VTTVLLLTCVQENVLLGPPKAKQLKVALPLRLPLMVVGIASTLPSGETEVYYYCNNKYNW